MNTKGYVAAHRTYFEPLNNRHEARAMKRYMKDQFEYLGIKSPIRREALKRFLAENGRPTADRLEPVIRTLWQLPYREYKYNAIDLLMKMKRIELEHLPLLEWMLVTDSWWDTVDAVADGLIGQRMLIHHPELMRPKAEAWIESGHMWLQRTALIFQMKFREKIDEKLLFDMILRRIDETDFFIRKAIGWALREHAKAFPDSVKAFVKKHDSRLSGLSKREALKHFK